MWILPTRSRPDSCKRFIKSWIDTSSSTPVIVRLDECDPQLDEMKSLYWPDEFTLSVGKREGVTKAVNDFFLKYDNEPWYGFLADDFLPQTKHWDKLLVEAAGNKFISYPNDMSYREDLPTMPCVGGDLVRSIGFFGFPKAYHYYVDTIYQFIGSHLNNVKRLDNVVVEHLHYEFNKSSIDIVYQESNEKFKQDKAIWKQWINTEGIELINRLILEGYKIDQEAVNT